MPPEPLVSIVTPCLNPGERLARCLDSVAAQTYPRIEHIVLDGGSNDGTQAMLDQRGMHFVSEADRGQTHAINKGFAMAQGEWLTWLAADDTLYPDAVERVIAALAEQPTAGWAYGRVLLVRDGGGELLPAPPEHIRLEDLDRGPVVSQPGTLVARWALDLAGPLDESLRLAMDFDLWLRLVEADVPSVFVPATLATYEVHAASKTGGLHWSAFEMEFGRVLLQHGRRRAAAAMLGHAAATSARGDDDLTDPARLESEIRRVVDGAGGRVDETVARAAAYAEAAEREIRFGRPRCFRYLRKRELWRVPEARRRVLLLLADGIKRR